MYIHDTTPTQHYKDQFAYRRFDTVDGSTCITDPIKLYPKQAHHILSQTALQQNQQVLSVANEL